MPVDSASPHQTCLSVGLCLERLKRLTRSGSVPRRAQCDCGYYHRLDIYTLSCAIEEWLSTIEWVILNKGLAIDCCWSLIWSVAVDRVSQRKRLTWSVEIIRYIDSYFAIIAHCLSFLHVWLLNKYISGLS